MEYGDKIKYMAIRDDVTCILLRHPDPIQEIAETDIVKGKIIKLKSGEDKVHTSIVYVSHPFGGKQENMKKAEVLARHLRDLGITCCGVISPIHNYGFMQYHDRGTENYNKELGQCIALLRNSDVVVVGGNWRESYGCCMEVISAIEYYNLPIIEIDDEELEGLD